MGERVTGAEDGGMTEDRGLWEPVEGGWGVLEEVETEVEFKNRFDTRLRVSDEEDDEEEVVNEHVVWTDEVETEEQEATEAEVVMVE